MAECNFCPSVDRQSSHHNTGTPLNSALALTSKHSLALHVQIKNAGTRSFCLPCWNAWTFRKPSAVRVNMAQPLHPPSLVILRCLGNLASFTLVYPVYPHLRNLIYPNLSSLIACSLESNIWVHRRLCALTVWVCDVTVPDNDVNTHPMLLLFIVYM